MSYSKRKETLINKYPAISDLEKRAKHRIPEVAWAYMTTGTGREALLEKNVNEFDEITLVPKFCQGEIKQSISTTIFGQTYNAPFAIAPIGLTGLMWPRAEVIFAETAKRYNIPMCLSTVATETPEVIGPVADGNGWFQLYTPREKELRLEILSRAKNSGFKTLVITVDIPTPSRRQRTKRAGLQTPPKITPGFILDALLNPVWTWNTLKRGLPKLRTVEEYAEFKSMMSVGSFVQEQLRGNLSWDFVAQIRDEWEGPVLIKGILHPEDAERAVQLGLDGIVVSNHGARQFDAAPTSLAMLPEIVKVAKGKSTIMFDSGIRSGLDILRAMSLGAEFCLCGRAFLYGVAALGSYGADHAAEILIGELQNNMAQLGLKSLSDLDQL